MLFRRFAKESRHQEPQSRISMRAHERLIDEEPEPDQPSGLVERTAGWAACAAVAVMATLLVANTPSGAIRIDQALDTFTRPLAATRVAITAPPPHAIQSVENDREIAEAMRRLAVDRDQLATRVGTLERSLDDITGSIRRPPPAKIASVAAEAAPQVASKSPPAGRTEPVAVAQFGVDLGSAQTLSGVRHLWSTMRTRFNPLLADVEPIVSVHATRDGKNELRLVAGPVEDERAATRLCASLGVAGVSCDMVLYDGQRLTSR
jgi:hypothetical protein